MKTKISTLLFAGLFLSGCANNLYMTYECDPSGATLYEANTNQKLGQCPTTLQYPLTDAVKAAGSVSLNGVTVVWVSGASVSVPSIHADLNVSLNQKINFDRPRDVAGYDIDANYGLNFDRNAIMERQAEAAENANDIADTANQLKALELQQNSQ